MISIVKTMYFLGPLGLKGTLHNIIYRYTFWGLLAKKEHVRIPSYRLLSDIELLGGAGGAAWGEWANQGMNEPRSNKAGFQDLLARWLPFSIGILSVMTLRFWNRHGCHPTKNFVGLKTNKHISCELPCGDTWKTSPKTLLIAICSVFLGLLRDLNFI